MASWVFVDLDDTIIDTKSFKQQFFSLLSSRSGKAEEEIVAIYEQKRASIQEENWFKDFLQSLSTLTGFSFPQIERMLNESLRQTQSDQALLTQIQELKHKKVLFTYGNQMFQQKKIQLFKLARVFDQVIITNHDKFEVFSDFVRRSPSDNFILIDNKVSLLTSVKKSFPQVRSLTKEEFRGG